MKYRGNVPKLLGTYGNVKAHGRGFHIAFVPGGQARTREGKCLGRLVMVPDHRRIIVSSPPRSAMAARFRLTTALSKGQSTRLLFG
jgi:hypothetical protein